MSSSGPTEGFGPYAQGGPCCVLVVVGTMVGGGARVVVVAVDALEVDALDVGVSSVAVVGGRDSVVFGRRTVLEVDVLDAGTSPAPCVWGAGRTRKYSTRVPTKATTSSQVDLRKRRAIRPPSSAPRRPAPQGWRSRPRVRRR